MGVGAIAATVIALLILAVPFTAGSNGSGGASTLHFTAIPSTGHTWSNITANGIHPSPRSDAAAAYDARDGVVVLFGGFAPAIAGGCGGFCSDTWTFHNGSWTQLAGLHPSARYGSAMAFDSATGSVLLFGGANGTSTLNDTWKFTHGTWAQLHPTASPPARYKAMVAYDPAIASVVIGGGESSIRNWSDMWGFHGGSWSQIPLPAPRGPGNPFHGRYSAMADDSRDHYLVYFGGQTGFGGNGTWNFSSGNWTLLSPPHVPSSRFGPGLAYDRALRALVLFGGEGSGPASTWSYHGGDWTEITIAHQPPVRSGPVLVYDAADQELVMFGGEGPTVLLGDTWILR